MNQNYTYSVLLQRIDAKAGTKATLRVEVESPDAATAKKLAEAKVPGYSACFTPTRIQEK
jgi:hypothetical protein